MKRVALVAAILVVLGGVYFFAAFSGWLGRLEVDGQIGTTARSPASMANERKAQAQAQRRVGADAGKEILFGDLHVHTTYSMDAFLTSLPILQGEGAHPPADACDFARYCSALDFYSINDHAEGLTPSKWAEIKESIRQCNAVAADPNAPDLVAFLGWEWTQMSTTADNHYGHKNVVLLETDEGKTPTRPIAALGPAYEAMRGSGGNGALVGLALSDLSRRQRYFDLIAFRSMVSDVPMCAEGVSVRDLPEDCSEVAATPRELFAKLDDWGFPSLVIPHGNAWGNTTPPGIDWERQLANGQHDPDRQTLVEVYSGHGNSEVYRPWRHQVRGADGALACPPPSEGFTPECHRAGEIVGERCLAAGFADAECDERAQRARGHFLAAERAGRLTVPGASAEDWLDAGQCPGCFQPAFRYRPGGSSQYALAVSGAGVPGAADDPKQRFRFGFIASSDNHTARPASGYKEFRALGMTDALHAEGSRGLASMLPIDSEVRPESIEINPDDVILLPGGDERLGSFFYTGGLVAVHAGARGRQAIWDALERKEVYGTSGPRILLWFDLLNAPADGPLPMGSEVAMAEAPRFRVRAVGSRKPLPGCPDDSVQGLTPERLSDLCMNECYNPSDERRSIERIEVVRIQPRVDRGEDVAMLIEDPWRSFECPRNESGCAIEFDDPRFGTAGRDVVYYVRAIEEPSDHVNGDPLRCERDAQGACLATRPCRSGGTGEDADECIDAERARAWSSPIFVDWKPSTDGAVSHWTAAKKEDSS